MALAGVDASLSASESRHTSSGNTGAVQIGGGGGYGISSTMLAIIAGAALLGFILSLKLGKGKKR